MNEIEGFLEGCGHDPFFHAHPFELDLIGNILVKMYRAGDDGPEWKAVWGRVREIVTPKVSPPGERYKELLPLLLQEFEQMILAGKIV